MKTEEVSLLENRLAEAVANAESAVLNRADVIIGSNDDDGVARFLNDLCDEL